ncbi:MAG: hypothetical protein WDN76_08685 [Alphaproteobacteria bacterium]
MFRFLSLAAVSQAVLVAQQLVILPMQIHAWGHETAALWLAVAALAAFVGVSDLGLRNVAFAAIASGQTGDRLSALWTVIRGQTVVCGAVVAAISLFHFAPQAGDKWWFVWLLTTATALDGFFLIRTSLLEAAGLITTCEALFLVLAVSRLVLGAVGIIFFHAGPATLSILWLASGLFSVALQSQLPAARKLAPVLGHWRLSGALDAYREARWSASGPIASWTQIQLPVMVLQAFAPPALTSSFVAIRSVFSLVRAIIAQVARIASVQFVERANAQGLESARALILLLAGGFAWIAAGISIGVFAENQMILGPLFALPHDNFVRIMTVTFAVSSIFSVHQIFSLALMRNGQFKRGGGASYLYMIGMIVVGVLAYAAKNPDLLVFGLVASDAIFLAQVVYPFFKPATEAQPAGEELRRARRSFVLSMALWVTLTIACWALFWAYFAGHQIAAFDIFRLASSLAIALLVVLAAAACFVGLSRHQIRDLLVKSPSGA